jgi:hypothetical protein
MYAIPAETATQGEPFQKENLPGPGKCATFFHATHFDTRKFVSPCGQFSADCKPPLHGGVKPCNHNTSRRCWKDFGFFQ